jgi:hypothetical protein
VELYVPRERRPREAFATRYQLGQPPGELEAVARRAGDVEMTEIARWRCLLARTRLENAKPITTSWPMVLARLRCQPLRALHADRRGVQRGVRARCCASGRNLTAAERERLKAIRADFGLPGLTSMITLVCGR